MSCPKRQSKTTIGIKWFCWLAVPDFWANYLWKNYWGEYSSGIERLSSQHILFVSICSFTEPVWRKFMCWQDPKRANHRSNDWLEFFPDWWVSHWIHKSIDRSIIRYKSIQVFEKLAVIDPDYMKRIRVIDGDLLKLELGISAADQQLIVDNVEIVLHSAADVRFDETLRHLILCNIRGTRELLRLSERIRQLEVFLHISTAYSHCTRKDIDEKFYESPVEPNQLIRIMETLNGDNEEILEIITDRFTSPSPNTYTFTKGITEELLRQYEKKLPIAIFRPSISEHAQTQRCILQFSYINICCALQLSQRTVIQCPAGSTMCMDWRVCWCLLAWASSVCCHTKRTWPVISFVLIMWWILFLPPVGSSTVRSELDCNECVHK